MTTNPTSTPQKRSFGSWTEPELQATFGLINVFDCIILDLWLRTAENQMVTDMEVRILDIYREKASWNIKNWSEDEIKMKLIGPIIGLVDFVIKNEQLGNIVAKDFSGFALSGRVGNFELNGTPDGMIALGQIIPQSPYFCLQEYKRTAETKDPTPQLLAAMLVAQAKNGAKKEQQRPIYGATVVGKQWQFVTLIGKKYCLSEVYLATTKDIITIFRILRQLKTIVTQILIEDGIL